jgi:CHAT domain-containing protein/tetratricopeptide (TPR) repeat protein
MKLLLLFGLLYCLLPSRLCAQDSPIDTSATYSDLEDMLAEKYEAGEYQNALAVAEFMSKKYADIDSFYGVALNDMALIHAALGDYVLAEKLYHQSLSILEHSVGDAHQYYGNTLNNLAILYHELGNYAAAEPLYKSALTIEYNISGEGFWYSVSLSNLAEFYRSSGNYVQAKKMFLQAIAIQEKMPLEYAYNYAISLSNLAVLYENQQDYAAAEPIYLKCLAIQARIVGKKSPIYIHTLSNLGKLYKRMSRFDKAQPLLEEVLAVRQNILGQNHPQYLDILDELGQLEYYKGNYEAAIAYYRRALMLNLVDSTTYRDMSQLADAQFRYNAQAAEMLQYYAASLFETYKINKDLQYLKDAYTISQATLNINERLRQAQEDEKDKLRTLRGNNDITAQTIAYGRELYQDKFLSDWFTYAEQNKSILLSDAIKGNKARKFGDLPDSLARTELRLQEQLKTLRHEENQAKTKDERVKIDKALQELQREQLSFKQSIEKRYPRYYKLKYANTTASVADVQRVLPPRALFLEFFVADTVTYLFAVSKKDVRFYALPISLKQLNSKIGELRAALSDYSNLFDNPDPAYQQYTLSADWLYQNLLQKALADVDALKINELIIVTDGNLGHIPFEVFLMSPAPTVTSPYSDLDYLLSKYKVSYNYSASLWLDNISTNSKKGKGKLLAIAADYTKSDSLSKHRSLSQQNLRKILKPLPFAQNEVNAIAEIFRGAFWQKQAANESDFKRRAPSFAVIHLGMHGLIDEHNYNQSALVFSENGDTLNDNFLEVWEISQIQLSAQLVTLSACETGYGRFEEGEGVMSIARAFMYSGVPAVVMSLWQVNDQSTNILMQLFYLKLESGLDKATALQQAKLEYVANAKGSAGHPAFWAAFVQLGDSRPVYIAGKKTDWTQHINFLVVLFIFVGIGVAGYIKNRKSANS